LAITVLSTYRHFKKFPKIEPDVFINTPIEIGIGRATKTKPEYARYIDVDYKPWLAIENFRRIEQELLYPETVSRKVLELHNKSITELFEKRAFENPWCWSRNWDGDKTYYNYTDEDGDDCSESYDHFIERAAVHKRNNTIFKTRCKFLREYKTGRGNYENLGTYFYKSHYHKELFLEIIQALGLVKKAEPKKSTVEIKAIESGFNPHVFTSREMAVSSNLYQEDEV
jgi:hypothetical protein